MKFIVILSFFLLTAFTKPPLVIVTMADIHGKVEPVYKINKSKIEEIGGFSRILTKINSIKNKYPNKVLVTMQGDFFLEDHKTGKYFSKFQGKAISSMMQKFHIDIACLGNHEFDFGADRAIELLKDCTFPIVLTNATFLPQNPKYCYKTYILEKNGYKIGFLGLMTPSLTFYSNIGIDMSNIMLEKNLIDEAKRAISKLKNKKVDFIVILSHLGLEEDKKLANEVNDIDIILGGHSHDKTEKPLIIDKKNEKTVIVHTGYSGKNLGVLKISKEKGIKKYDWELVKINSTIKKDPEMESQIKSFQKQCISDSTIQANSTVILDSRKHLIRTKETVMGNFITDAFRNYFNSDIVFISGDAIRGNKIILPGIITDSDIKDFFIFQHFYKVKIKGKFLKEILEISISKYPKRSYNFWQVSGLKFSFNPSAQPAILLKDEKDKFTILQKGDRVIDIAILTQNGSYSPIDENKEYSILFNPSITPMERDCLLFKHAIEITKLDITPLEVLMRYLKNIKTISSKIEDRIMVE